LNQICKIYKRNQKTEKEKVKEEIKIEKGAPGTTFGPVPEASRGPSSIFPELVRALALSH
jgi:hypothetical protein